MDKDLKKLLEDESEDALLARIQEESLRYYNEVELPRRAAGGKQHNEVVESCSRSKPTEEEPQQPHCSKNMDISNSPLKNVFYKGTDCGAEGFHLAAGETYVYPTNYPIRKYQKTIIHSALFHNTLVSLPTGLGKTFIGAVVMYNYYRWFPQGKIVFMAPTKPLVAQQIRACHNIMAIPIKDTIEMTGTMNPVDRLQHWKTKRVFFLTPQVMANDLRSGVCPAKLFKCVVIDEAHRATKEYSFCHVIKELEKAGGVFRVLALSATPGSNVKAVIEVVENLRISTLELRGEDSPDVTPYTHAKQIEPVFLSLSKCIMDLLEQFLVIFERYARTLRDSRLITCNVRNLTRFQLLKVSEKIRLRPPNGMSKAKAGFLMSDLMVCIALAHGLELLQTYGLRAFYQYFTGCEDEEHRKAAFTRLSQDAEFHQLMSNLQGAVSSPMDQVWSHPKHEHIVKILKEHFSKAEEQGTDSKVIIFCQYRVVVTEVYELLQKVHPLIKPVMFIGQGVGKDKSGLPQKKQLEVMKQFREGRSNVMIATCVAEEGLDIGSVDLLMLMEVQRSPVRLVQRLGRTGRHRQGRCVVLLTKGKEVQKFNEAMAIRKSFLTNIQNSKALAAHLYKEEPTMVPPSLMPKMQLVHINVPERITPAKPKKQSDIRQALLNKIEDSEEVEESPFLSPEQMEQVREELNSLQLNFDRLHFPKSSHLFQRLNDSAMDMEELFRPTFSQQSEFNDWNRVLQQTYLISHSHDTELLCHMLNKAENIQMGEHLDIINTQMDIGNYVTNKKKSKNKAVNKNNENISKKKKSDNEKRHGMDIRQCMALATDKARLTQDVFQENDIIIINDLTDKNLISSQQWTSLPNEDSSKNIRKVVDCSMCKSLFNEFDFDSKNQNTQHFPITLDCLTAVEFLVSNLTKDIVANININSIVDNEPYKLQTNKFSYHDFNQSNDIESTQSSGITGANETLNMGFQTLLQKLDDNNINPLNVVMSDENAEFFNLEDIFNEDDDFDILKPNSNKCPKYSTPLKKPFSMNEGKISNIKQHNNDSKHDSNIRTKISSTNKANVFKIPQLKLNIKPFKSPQRENNNSNINTMSPESPVLSGQISKLNISSNKLNLFNRVPSPESPILSGQISNCNISPIKLKVSNKVPSPESPILSGQISKRNISPIKLNVLNKVPSPESPILSGQISKRNISPIKLKVSNKVSSPESPILSGQISKHHTSPIKFNVSNKILSPESPILSGQILDQKMSSLSKLERKVLFHESKTTKPGVENDASFCKPLDNNSAGPSLAEVDEGSLLSASELFDDDSGEENKKVDLEQSSMYTITQMVTKVRDMANKINPKSRYIQSSNNSININDVTKFNNIEEDTVFENIDIDALIGSSQNPNITRNENKKESLLDFRKSFNLKNDNNMDLSHSSKPNDSILSEVTKEDGSPFTETKPVTSTPLHVKETKVNTDSDSNSDVFLSPPVKKKSTSPLAKKKNISSPAIKKNIIPTKPKNVARELKTKKLFIELEADVSGPVCSSDEENTSGLDELDESFINDLTERAGTCMDQTSIDMQARYLQSVRSPVKKMGGYKIPVVTKPMRKEDVFSQMVDDDDDSYENDSFCCDATEIPADEDSSFLEIAEQILEKKKKNRKLHKRKRISSESSIEDLPVKPRKAKRKRVFSSSSSDREMLLLDKLHKNKKPHLLTSDSDSDRTD